MTYSPANGKLFRCFFMFECFYFLGQGVATIQLIDAVKHLIHNHSVYMYK